MTTVSVVPDEGSGGEAPYRVRHGLAETGLFTLERLADAARGHDLTDIPCGGHALSDRLGAPEIIASIEVNPGWAVLRDPCWIADQRRALDDALESVRSWLAHGDPGMHDPDRSGIVTSAGAVTHLHVDVDESFLLQVSGSKTVGFVNPEVLRPDDVARVVRGAGRPLELARHEVEGRLQKFVLGPGEGVHIPFGWPHFTRVEGQASVSVSLAFQTDRTVALRHRLGAMAT